MSANNRVYFLIALMALGASASAETSTPKQR